NKMRIDGRNLVWGLGMRNGEKGYGLDMEVKSKKGLVRGVIERLEIGGLEVSVGEDKYKDELEEKLKKVVLEGIERYVKG
ncbi:type II toxin-antitoxin system PemK/MazF family toxin, partial [Staphylococcus epidermidis]|uniref:type II toxin-antitoxin system PemK/MazF family toxin n=1 Tax=Staphylococcus epidermidis TaxID=1282 RepID=UPI001C92DE44